MKGAGLVQARREGTWMHYRLAPPRIPLAERLTGCLRDCLEGHRTVQADRKRLARATSRSQCVATRSRGKR